MSMYDFQAIIRNLDPENTGFINWKLLITCVILLRSPIMTEKECEAIKSKAGEEGVMTKDDFVKCAMWFDATEVSKDRDYSIPFERLEMVKDHLFRVHCCTIEGREEPVVVLGDLCEMLMVPARIYPKESTSMVYNDFLFAEVKTVQK